MHKMKEWEYVAQCTSCTTHDSYIFIQKFFFQSELSWRLTLKHVKDFNELQITERYAVNTVKCNGKVVLVYTLKVYWGVEVQLHLLLKSSCPGCFIPQKRAPEYPLYTRLGEPRSGLDALEKQKVSCLCWELTNDFCIMRPVA